MQHFWKVVDTFKRGQKSRVRMVIRSNSAIYGEACDKRLRRDMEGFLF